MSEYENWPDKHRKRFIRTDHQEKETPTKMDAMIIADNIQDIAEHRIRTPYADEETEKRQKFMIELIKEHSYAIAVEIIKKSIKENRPELIKSVTKKARVGIRQIPSEGITVKDLRPMREYDSAHKEIFYEIIPKVIKEQETIIELREENAAIEKEKLKERVKQAKEKAEKQTSMDRFNK